MADTKISALTAVATPAGTDEFAVNQAGTSKKMTLNQVSGYGTSFLAANATNATNTLAATGLTVPVTSGQKYRIQASLFFNEANEGYVFDFGTSAAATYFIAFGIGSSSTIGVGVSFDDNTSITGTYTAATSQGELYLAINGFYQPSASGNLLIRFAQVSHAVGVLTLYRGSSLSRYDIS